MDSASVASPRSGVGRATTAWPSLFNSRITPPKPDASENAPCTRTIVVPGTLFGPGPLPIRDSDTITPPFIYALDPRHDLRFTIWPDLDAVDWTVVLVGRVVSHTRGRFTTIAGRSREARAERGVHLHPRGSVALAGPPLGWGD